MAKQLKLYCSDSESLIEVWDIFFESMLRITVEDNINSHRVGVYNPITQGSYKSVIGLYNTFINLKWHSCYAAILETGLNPKQQFDLTTNLVKNCEKLYILTHSEHVFNAIRCQVGDSVRAENITIDYYSNKEVINPVMDNKGRIDTWPLGFFDHSEIELEILLNRFDK